MQKRKRTRSSIFGIIFIIVLAAAGGLVIYLTAGFEPEAKYEPVVLPQTEAGTGDFIADAEEEVPMDWTEFRDEKISFKYPDNWFFQEQGDFLIFTSWDPMANPGAGAGGLELIVGKVKTDLSLEQYVSDYINENVNSDPSYSLLGRSQRVLGGQPAILAQSTTALEGGKAIQSIFALRGNELWSVDLVGQILNEEFQEVFDGIVESFSFL
ncbi:hypothetical protein KJ969_02195 [Patescibacteria group bacterium]|nr:hypothetical protein [Patescibacteria group bacterium]MBU1922343.1 hypothetical protein [Patescibacteria group bacterium]